MNYPNKKKFDSQAKNQQQSDDRIYGWNMCHDAFQKTCNILKEYILFSFIVGLIIGSMVTYYIQSF